MALYDDLKTSVQQGVKDTAREYYSRAKDKLFDRIANKQPKTDLEKNVRERFANTQSGLEAENQYAKSKIEKFFSKPMNLVLTLIALFLLARTFGR